MDDIKKLLRRIRKKDRLLIQQVLLKIFSNDTKGLNIKILKGYQHIFRVRIGNYRVIYYQEGKEIYLKAIKKRDESTYSDF